MSKKRIGAIWMLLLVLLSLTWVVYGTGSDVAFIDSCTIMFIIGEIIERSVMVNFSGPIEVFIPSDLSDFVLDQVGTVDQVADLLIRALRCFRDCPFRQEQREHEQGASYEAHDILLKDYESWVESL